MPPRIFHVSENPNIKIFEPLPAPNKDAGVVGKAVWAVDKRHLVNYLLPRECPRVTFGISENTSPKDRDNFFNNENLGLRQVVVEDNWIERINSTDLYLYELNPQNFELIDATAGYYVSRSTETPISCTKLDNLVVHIESQGVIFSSVPNLWGLIDQVGRSSLEFSIIRKRNALPRVG